jgi:murein endopeptidase
LRSGKGYFIRRPERAFGANHAVHAVEQAVAVVKRKHSRVHKLAIGDLSAKTGGKISGHRSHQSGRDVDIGLYFKKKPNGYPEEFVVGTARNLDFAATWTLVSTFAGMSEADNGVERIFLDYGVQKLLYKWAEDHGVSDEKLRRMFQYPNGKGSGSGVIRHVAGHADHLHVRFKCPENDDDCK